MDEDTTAREDLGYRLNTKSNVLNYPKSKGARMLNEPGSSPEQSAVCRVRFKYGQYAGDVKRLAWEFAEPLIKQNKVEFIEWVR
jgi:hypothetical protein